LRHSAQCFFYRICLPAFFCAILTGCGGNGNNIEPPVLSPEDTIFEQCDNAATLINEHNFIQGCLLLKNLHAEYPNSVTVLSTIVRLLPSRGQTVEGLNVLNCALRLADLTEDTLEISLANALWLNLISDESTGEVSLSVTRILSSRGNLIFDLAASALFDKKPEIRTKAFLILEQAGRISEQDRIRQYFMNFIDLFACVTKEPFIEANSFFNAFPAGPKWEQILAGLNLPQPHQLNSLETVGILEEDICRTLGRLFFGLVEPLAADWVNQDAVLKKRLNGFLIFLYAGKAGTLSMDFFVHNLTQFNAECIGCNIRYFLRLYRLSLDAVCPGGRADQRWYSVLLEGRFLLLDLIAQNEHFAPDEFRDCVQLTDALLAGAN
ncbi:MAG: hypothetical protein PHQ23_16290, partial [Candidatus Wallbacteria bacterium]|nr:hypothetical protein [Candidatus Wallbacteria bacterium]